MRFYVFLPPVRGCLNGFAAGVTCLERADYDIKIGIFREGFLLGCKTDNFCKIAFRGTFTKVMPFYPFKKWLGFIFHMLQHRKEFPPLDGMAQTSRVSVLRGTGCQKCKCLSWTLHFASSHSLKAFVFLHLSLEDKCSSESIPDFLLICGR